LSYAEVTVVSPMDFLRLPLAALIGWVLYNEGFDSISIAGAALILVGNLINLRRRSVVVASA
jgi:drug/metabolite transporter (DMT)-like permease